MYTLSFKDGYGKTREIAKIDSEGKSAQEISRLIFKEIHAFCDERGFRIYYSRMWNTENNSTMIDVGSHSEFFVVTPMIM